MKEELDAGKKEEEEGAVDEIKKSFFEKNRQRRKALVWN